MPKQYYFSHVQITVASLLETRNETVVNRTATQVENNSYLLTNLIPGNIYNVSIKTIASDGEAPVRYSDLFFAAPRRTSTLRISSAQV